MLVDKFPDGFRVVTVHLAGRSRLVQGRVGFENGQTPRRVGGFVPGRPPSRRPKVVKGPNPFQEGVGVGLFGLKVPHKIDKFPVGVLPHAHVLGKPVGIHALSHHLLDKGLKGKIVARQGLFVGDHGKGVAGWNLYALVGLAAFLGGVGALQFATQLLEMGARHGGLPIGSSSL